MSKSQIKVFLGVLVVSFFMLGFLCPAQEAAAQTCNNVTSTNYKNCNEPGGCNNCKVAALRPGGKITVAEANAVLKCSKKTGCNGPAPNLNAAYDLNNDGFVNSKDYAIAQKCLGCAASPSPWK
jgi:hypothetical protein